MDISTKTASKPLGSSKIDASQTANETFEKINAAATETTTLLQESCSKAVKGAQEYNAKCMQFFNANAKAAAEFVEELSSVKSPSEFFELSTNHSRKQFEALTEQGKELSALIQQNTNAALEPLREGTARAFSKLSR